MKTELVKEAVLKDRWNKLKKVTIKNLDFAITDLQKQFIKQYSYLCGGIMENLESKKRNENNETLNYIIEQQIIWLHEFIMLEKQPIKTKRIKNLIIDLLKNHKDLLNTIDDVKVVMNCMSIYENICRLQQMKSNLIKDKIKFSIFDDPLDFFNKMINEILKIENHVFNNDEAEFIWDYV